MDEAKHSERMYRQAKKRANDKAIEKCAEELMHHIDVKKGFRRKGFVDTYQKELECENCGLVEIFNIPKGKFISKFLEETICPKCGCDTLRCN